MKNIYGIAAVLIAVFLLFGCLGIGEQTATPADGKSNYAPALPGMSEAGSTGGYDSSGNAVTLQDKMIIKTGSAEIEVPEKTLEDRYTKLKTMIGNYQGEITDSSYTETENEKYYYVTVKLDPQKFDKFATQLSDIGTVKSLSSNSQDVTTQYIDISAKLDNLKASRDRILALYNKTDNISDILQLEQELNRLQYEIDSTTQQKLYYERQATKATMTIQLVEPAPVIDTTLFNPFGQLLNVFITGLALSLTLIAGLLGFVIPALIVLAVLYVIIKALFFKGKKQEKTTEKK